MDGIATRVRNHHWTADAGLQPNNDTDIFRQIARRSTGPRAASRNGVKNMRGLRT